MIFKEYGVVFDGLNSNPILRGWEGITVKYKPDDGSQARAQRCFAPSPSSYILRNVIPAM